MVSIPFTIPYPEDDQFYMYTGKSEDNNILGVIASDPENYVFICQKGESDHYYNNAKAIIRITKVDYADDNGLELHFEYIQSPENGVLDSENWEISAVEYKFDVKSGDNVAWNGKIWDILSGTIDTSNFATKDDLNNIKIDTSDLATKAELTLKADKAISLAGYGIKDAYTKTEIDNKFTDIDSEYNYCGETIIANGGAIINEANVGDVYTVSEDLPGHTQGVF